MLISYNFIRNSTAIDKSILLILISGQDGDRCVSHRAIDAFMSNCQSIVIKLMNFPTLLITTQNSNSLNQMS